MSQHNPRNKNSLQEGLSPTLLLNPDPTLIPNLRPEGLRLNLTLGIKTVYRTGCPPTLFSNPDPTLILTLRPEDLRFNLTLGLKAIYRTNYTSLLS